MLTHIYLVDIPQLGVFMEDEFIEHFWALKAPPRTPWSSPSASLNSGYMAAINSACPQHCYLHK